MKTFVSSQSHLLAPASHDIRPEKKIHIMGFLDRIANDMVASLGRVFNRSSDQDRSFVKNVNEFDGMFSGMSLQQLQAVSNDLRLKLHRQGLQPQIVAETFALVREMAKRVLGMHHYECQIMGGWAMTRGMIAEMETGEGKTLTATLPACTAAMMGVPVHVITVNDYLATRDMELMAPLYKALGLSVGCVTSGLSPEQRRQEYLCDITYCTNKELVFDYLKDSIILGDRTDSLSLQAEYLHGTDARVRRLLLRGLHFAIVDEADSVLIDEARTPLIISGQAGGEDEERVMRQAMDVASEMKEGEDYFNDREHTAIELTDSGLQLIQQRTESLGPLWAGSVRRAELVRLALSSVHLFIKDEHYIVRDGKIQIIDPFTGRVMPDRSWERGLQQLLELKEDCEVTRRRETLARISYQNFFRRYLQMCGMTGTANEVASELRSVYELSVATIPTNSPCKRMCLSSQIHHDEKKKWEIVVERVKSLHLEGRPVLVGTRTVAASEHASLLLKEAGLPHQVLNAKQDVDEADIISKAGEPGNITIATNMAGRGTDIKLAEGVSSKGGLHVILTERHEAGRIDRQLEGRCARQGDPGSFEAIVSMEDSIIKGEVSSLVDWFIQRFDGKDHRFEQWFRRRLVKRAQKKLERLHHKMRKDLLKMDQRMSEQLSFSGRIN